jgi:hypothetical protein
LVVVIFKKIGALEEASPNQKYIFGLISKFKKKRACSVYVSRNKSPHKIEFYEKKNKKGAVINHSQKGVAPRKVGYSQNKSS